MKRIYVCDLAIKLSVFHPKTALRAAIMERRSVGAKIIPNFKLTDIIQIEAVFSK